MDYEKLTDEEHQCGLRFSQDEASVVRAVYREHMSALASKGNNSSISEFDIEMSDYGTSGARGFKKFLTHETIVTMLNNFHENTDDAVTNIANSVGVPGYDNMFMSRRITLGKDALKLAVQIEGAVMGQQLSDALEAIPEIEHPHRQG